MTAVNATVAPPHLRPVPARSAARRLWDRFGWNVALVAEIALLVIFLELLVVGAGLWNRDFVPPPSDIAESFQRLARVGVLADNVAFSLSNFVVAYVSASVIGILVGLGLGTIPLMRLLLGSLVWIVYAIPKVALAPLFVMWLGFGSESKIAVIFLFSFFPVVVNVWVGAESVDRTLLRAGSVFGASRLDLYRKVVLPYILPYTLTGLRLAIARGLVGVVIAEFVGSTAGIGYLIGILSSEFDLAGALALTVILMITANVSMVVLDEVRRRLAPWYREGII